MPTSPGERAHDIYMTGLRNAHAMERQALSIMKNQIDRTVHFPELAQRLREHVTETNGQIERIEALLDAYGDSHSSFKDAVMSMTGNLAALSHAAADDEILKNGFADFAFENYEIAAYKSLSAMAEACGHAGDLIPLEESLKEEQEMARWLDENLQPITLRYLSLEQQDVARASR